MGGARATHSAFGTPFLSGAASGVALAAAVLLMWRAPPRESAATGRLANALMTPGMFNFTQLAYNKYRNYDGRGENAVCRRISVDDHDAVGRSCPPSTTCITAGNVLNNSATGTGTSYMCYTGRIAKPENVYSRL